MEDPKPIPGQNVPKEKPEPKPEPSKPQPKK